MAKAAAAREREAGHLLPDPEPEEKPENPLRLPWAKPAGTCIITADGGPTIHVREGTATPSTTLENRAALRDALYYAAKVHGPMRELLWDIEAWMCHHRPTDQFTDVSIAPWKALLDRITALLGTEEEG